MPHSRYLGLLKTVPALAHVLEHPLGRDTQLGHGLVVVFLPRLVGVRANCVAMCTGGECRVTEKHPVSRVDCAMSQFSELAVEAGGGPHGAVVAMATAGHRQAEGGHRYVFNRADAEAPGAQGKGESCG